MLVMALSIGSMLLKTVWPSEMGLTLLWLALLWRLALLEGALA